MSKLKLLDLFSGIGGFSLGLERSGYFETVAFCEIEKFPRAVLKKHWPEVPQYDDVRTLTGDRLRTDGISVDAICGGFPCQDISHAGLGAGIEGERSGLWKEYARIIGEIRPRYVIVENVAALLGRGLGVVLSDLAEIGYDAEWRVVAASEVGAWHRRDRLWLVAYPSVVQRNGSDDHTQISMGQITLPQFGNDGREISFPDARSSRPSGQGEFIKPVNTATRLNWETAWSKHSSIRDIWAAEPNVGRVANGIPRRVDRLAALGNAVVPQIPELIGRAIGEYESNP